MKKILNVFAKFNEIDFINSRFGSKHNAIRFYPADRCLLVYLAVNPFGPKLTNKTVRLSNCHNFDCKDSDG